MEQLGGVLTGTVANGHLDRVSRWLSGGNMRAHHTSAGCFHLSIVLLTVFTPLLGPGFAFGQVAERTVSLETPIGTLESACNGGNGPACVFAGYKYSHGVEVTRDVNLALKFDRLGCQLQQSSGCFNGASVYIQADKNSASNRHEASILYSSACRLGEKDGCAAVAAISKMDADDATKKEDIINHIEHSYVKETDFRNLVHQLANCINLDQFNRIEDGYLAMKWAKEDAGGWETMTYPQLEDILKKSEKLLQDYVAIFEIAKSNANTHKCEH